MGVSGRWHGRTNRGVMKLRRDRAEARLTSPDNLNGYLYVITHSVLAGVVQIGWDHKPDRRRWVAARDLELAAPFVLEWQSPTFLAGASTYHSEICRRLQIFRLDIKGHSEPDGSFAFLSVEPDIARQVAAAVLATTVL